MNNLGLTTVMDPGDKRNINLVLIHHDELGELSCTIWSYDDKPENFWPKEWVPQERGMETDRIMIWGYNAPSAPFSPGITMNVSVDLLNVLLLNHVGQVSNLFCLPTRPIMTVFFKDKFGCICVPYQHGRIDSEEGEWTELPVHFLSSDLNHRRQSVAQQIL